MVLVMQYLYMYYLKVAATHRVATERNFTGYIAIIKDSIYLECKGLWSVKGALAIPL